MHHFYMKAAWIVCGNDRLSHDQILNVNLMKKWYELIKSYRLWLHTHTPVAAVMHHFVATIMNQRRQNIYKMCVNTCEHQAFVKDDANMWAGMQETLKVQKLSWIFEMCPHWCGHGLNSRVERLEGWAESLVNSKPGINSPQRQRSLCPRINWQL